MPNARCQTVVRVITVITLYRDTRCVPAGRCTTVRASSPPLETRSVRFDLADALDRAILASLRGPSRRPLSLETRVDIPPRRRRKAFSALKRSTVASARLLEFSHAALLVRAQSDKRIRGLMIHGGRPVRIMEGLREDESEPVSCHVVRGDGYTGATRWMD